MDSWSIENYVDSRGRTPVEEFLNPLPPADRARIIHTVNMLGEFGLALGPPYVKHLQGKLWEMRIRSGRKAYRVIYFAFTGRRFILTTRFSEKNAEDAQEKDDHCRATIS